MNACFVSILFIINRAYYRREIYVSKLAGLIIGGKFVPKFLNVQLVILLGFIIIIILYFIILYYYYNIRVLVRNS